MKIFLLQTLVFLASFLIFQIELILGKAILPGYGGGYLIWGISVVFYQGLLFLGYFYVHVLSRNAPFRKFRNWQSGLLLLSLFFLPLNIERLQTPSYALPAAVEIVQLLFMTVGFIFFILSSISVYIQVYLLRSTLPERENPYVLYAGSNLGAFAGLLTYPFLFEPNLDISLQLKVWAFSYAALVVLFLAVQWVVPTRAAENNSGGPLVRTEPIRLARWLLLSAAGSAMFLSVTNELTFNFAPAPFLWIIPLGIYLLTLALAFKRNPFCPDTIQRRFYLFATAGILLFLFKFTGNNPLEYLIMVLLGLQLPFYTLAILSEPLLLLVLCFLFCLVCHYRLNQDKPEDPGQLTIFYLAVSVGGFLGGVLINWLVPLIFNVTPEFLISVLLAAGAFSLFPPAQLLDKKSFSLSGILILALTVTWPGIKMYLPGASAQVASLAVLCVLFVLFYFLQEKHFQFALIVLGLIAVVSLLDYFAPEQKVIFKKRNYYGVYKVYDEGNYRLMRHGAILHGAQILDDPGPPVPLVYYHRDSPIGEVLGVLNLPRVALVGLGAGSLAAYARSSDSYDYFELDPLVGEMAQKYFSFISKSQGTVKMIYGDARVSLRKVDAGQYDAVVVDVFNSGSIPVHMMTLEALEDFRRVMRPGGVVFFHVSNLYMNLVPVVHANAGALMMSSCIKSTGSFNPPAREATIWVAVSENKELCPLLESSLKWRGLNLEKQSQPWTDRYSSIFSAIMD